MSAAIYDSRLFAQPWDFVVIGGGTAGLVASRTAASFGARVLLIEPARLGGDCLWTGCVPSKSLIAAAHAASTAVVSQSLGVHAEGATVDFGAVMSHLHTAMHTIAPVDSAESLEHDGVTVLRGSARFLDRRNLIVDGQTIRFRQAMIATGSRPRTLDTDGADTLAALTSETIWDLTEQPNRLVVVGGGAIGCELGQALARLGSHVTLIQRGPRLIPKESAQAEAIVSAALVADGVDIRRGRTVRRVETTAGHAGSLTLDDGTAVDFDRVLVAVGRAADTGSLALDSAGVSVDDRGTVIVDDNLRTTNTRIWAAGDVTALPQFTHTAGVNGSIAASNAILGLKRKIDRRVVPRVTFTQPEVAAVGLQAADTVTSKHRVVTIDHRHLDRAITEATMSGFTQIVTDRKGVLLGATIVGPRAGESLAEVTLAVKNRLTAGQIAGTTHPYPTFNDAVWNACVSIVRERLGGGALRRVTRVLAVIRRVRMR
ncbi:dihydrolipoyl dehydrogenase family protein [Rathayibacter soli]|uniref:dihydrolipoyl dehydrogenase family protein n=1 Tax=Rathayibacter soli TaxID=3144168 RepID=UPI0027E44887|nr:FAD-dependent oxidoreductase [Glaciibacter superstes]